MELDARIARHKAIEEFRKRPLIVYATSTRANVAAMMAGDAVREFIDQINATPADQKRVDILLHSTGGDALTAWKLMSILRERFDHVSVLVPFMAFSAATLFCLGADEIVMHPHASLGPIDPQVMMKQPDGTLRRFSYEDVGAFIRFLEEEVKISEQQHRATVIERLFSAVDALNLGAAKRASELSTTVGTRLLLLHMKSTEDKSRAKQIAINLNKTFFDHSDAVSRSRARELHLKVAKPDTAIEKLIWDDYLGLEAYMELRKPFNALQHVLADATAAQALRPTAPLALPANTPPQLAQQIWQAAATQALQAVGAAFEVEYTLVNAIIESARAASEFRTSGNLTGARMPNGEVQLAATDTESAWKKVDLPAPAPAPALAT